MKTINQYLIELDKTTARQYNEFFIDFCDYFGFDMGEWDDCEEMKCYFLISWYCTDSWVGVRAYFLNGEFVAISSQIGRKYDQEFEWVSKEAYYKVKEYIASKTLLSKIDIPIIDYEQDISSWEQK